MVRLLLDNGADPNLKNSKDDTSLSVVMASSKNLRRDSRKGIIKLLLDKGADPQMKMDRNFTPPHFCCNRQRYRSIRDIAYSS